MNFAKRIEAFFKEYGEAVTVNVANEKYSVFAQIQPLRYKNKLYIEKVRTELGFKDGECLLYLGPASPNFSGRELSTEISTETESYAVSRADAIKVGGKTQYIWAVLIPKSEGGDEN